MLPPDPSMNESNHQSASEKESTSGPVDNMCWYCLAEMAACYSGDNKKYFDGRLQKAEKKEVKCDCTVPAYLRMNAAGYCGCKCTCPNVRYTKIITYNHKHEPIKVEYKEHKCSN